MTDAEALLRSAPAELMETEDHLTQLGKALSAQDRVAEAVACLQAALKTSPTASFWSVVQLSMALLKTGNPEDALDRARSATRLAGAQWATTFEGLALQQIGRIDEALDIQREAVAAAPDNSWTLTNLGLVLKAIGRDAEALEAHRAAAAIPVANLWLPFEAKLRPGWAQEILRDAYRILGIQPS
jgi:tetratricopeptide (TPR) repeat protein